MRLKLITLDPGHFHAALIQKQMYPEVSKRVNVYAPLGPDLVEHLGRIARFNLREENPTSWEMDIHAGPDFLKRMLEERRGNVVVISGRNRGKIGRIKAAVEAGLNVLADKPWIIDPDDVPMLESALSEAERLGVVAYDIMTERYEITSILQRQFVNDPDVFGAPIPGSPDEPGVHMKSVHHLLKTVAGVPNLRPAWFFDIEQQGEALADVGTHLVDLVQWTLFPEHSIDYRTEIALLGARRWPTLITAVQFRRVTGEDRFPGFLAPARKAGYLEYFCNSALSYTLRGIHVQLEALWNFEAPAGADDTHFAAYRGTRARVEVRQGQEENYRPELYIVPAPDAAATVLATVRNRVEELQARYPGLALIDLAGRLLIAIPETFRVGHEAHFAQVTNKFFRYVKDPHLLPGWEKPNMLAKYHVCTRSVELGRGSAHQGG